MRRAGWQTRTGQRWARTAAAGRARACLWHAYLHLLHQPGWAGHVAAGFDVAALFNDCARLLTQAERRLCPYSRPEDEARGGHHCSHCGGAK